MSAAATATTIAVGVGKFLAIVGKIFSMEKSSQELITFVGKNTYCHLK